MGISNSQVVYFLVPMILLIVLLFVFVMWLLLPNSRIFHSDTHQLSDEQFLEFAETEIEFLEQRKSLLKSTLEGAVCTDEGNFIYDLESIRPNSSLDENNSESYKGNSAESSSILPHSPREFSVSIIEPKLTHEDNLESNKTTLVELIKNTTVLVINADTSVTGSGFFVTPEHIVTNDHVVEGNQGNLYVAGPSLERIRQTNLVANSGSFIETNDDFALMHIPGLSNPYLNIRVPNNSIQLDTVVAAGFPGDYMESDFSISQLISGNSMNNPEDVYISVGTVNGEPSIFHGVKVILHSASISVGNSGGPLLDTCGNLIGVNSFVRSDDVRTINFALPSGRLLDFLDRTGIKIDSALTECVPELVNNSNSNREVPY